MNIKNILRFCISVISGWWTITEEGVNDSMLSQGTLPPERPGKWGTTKGEQDIIHRNTKQKHPCCCHLRSLQIIRFSRFSRLQLFFSFPGGSLLLAEGNMWQQWFRMKSVRFNMLCLSYGLPKAQYSDCLEKTFRVCSAASKMPIKQHSEKEEGMHLGRVLLRRMQDEMDYLSAGLLWFQPKCHILSIVDRTYYREGNRALMADIYFLRFHKVFCLSWSVFYTTACLMKSFCCPFQQF